MTILAVSFWVRILRWKSRDGLGSHSHAIQSQLNVSPLELASLLRPLSNPNSLIKLLTLNSVITRLTKQISALFELKMLNGCDGTGCCIDVYSLAETDTGIILYAESLDSQRKSGLLCV